MCGCSFEGYDIALDASVGAITVTSENVFVNNGTAVQVIRLNDFISSYYFRIVEPTGLFIVGIQLRKTYWPNRV